MNKLFPSVSLLRILPGIYNLKSCLNVCVLGDETRFEIIKKVNAFMNNKSLWVHLGQVNFVNSNFSGIDLLYEIDETLKEESYRLKIDKDVIIISYSSASGAFYATKTLDQIFDNRTINNLEIFDEPKVSIRGYMMDISRDKVPTVATIKKVIDIISNLKMNHFELYVEGFSFEYKSFTEFLENDGFITLEEYKEIEQYCIDRFIDFVPNQNGFGHMAKWLETKEYKDLAVCPDGMMMWGRWRKPNTLDPNDSGSLELIKKMYRDMIPYTKSKYFNMNFDEPFELGHGKSQEMNVLDIYLDYTLKVYKEIKQYQKIPLIWGDVLIKHKDSWDRLPKDMIFLDWGYDAAYPFRDHAKALQNKGISFMTAPGTTAWCSFFGRYLDWYENIKNAVDAVIEYNGKGTILTDWGDFGHLQFLPISYAPIVYMGMYSWSGKEGTILNVRDYINNVIVKDDNKVIGDLLLSLSEYNRYDTEYSGNGTKTFYTFMWACSAITDTKDTNLDPIEYYKQKIGSSYLSYPKFRILRKFLNTKLEEMEFISLNQNKDEISLIQREIIQSIKLLKMIHKVSIAYNDEFTLEKRINYLEEVVASKEDFLEEQKKLWLARNKSGGLQSSLKYIECFLEFASKTLNYLSRMGE